MKRRPWKARRCGGQPAPAPAPWPSRASNGPVPRSYPGSARASGRRRATTSFGLPNSSNRQPGGTSHFPPARTASEMARRAQSATQHRGPLGGRLRAASWRQALPEVGGDLIVSPVGHAGVGERAHDLQHHRPQAPLPLHCTVGPTDHRDHTESTVTCTVWRFRASGKVRAACTETIVWRVGRAPLPHALVSTAPTAARLREDASRPAPTRVGPELAADG